MPRSTTEWIGKSDDSPVPPRVRLRVFERDNGHCASCGRKIYPGDKWITDHAIALINGGENRENNLRTICDWCDKKVKTPADVKEKSIVYAKKLSHRGIRKKGRKIMGSKGTGFRRKVDGTIVKVEE